MPSGLSNFRRTVGRGSNTLDNIDFDSLALKVWRETKVKVYQDTASKLESIFSLYEDRNQKKDRLRKFIEDSNEKSTNISNEYNSLIANITNTQEMSKRTNLERYQQQLTDLSKIISQASDTISELEKRYTQRLQEYENKVNTSETKITSAIGYVSKILKNFDIKSSDFDVTVTQEQADEMSVEQIVDLCKISAEQINLLEKSDISQIEEIINSLDDKKSKIVGGAAALASILAAPVVLGVGAFMFGKSGAANRKTYLKVRELSEQILKCFKLLQLKKNNFMNEFEKLKPNRKEVDDEIIRIRTEAKEREQRDKQAIDEKYKESQMMNDGNQVQEQINAALAEGRQKLDEISEKSTAHVEKERKELDEMMQEVNKELDEFLLQQKRPDLCVDRQTELAKQKKDVIELIRSLNKLKSMETLEYYTSLPNGEIMTESWEKIIEFDKSQLALRDSLRQKKAELESQGITLETLQEDLNRLIDRESELYFVNTSGLHLGKRLLMNKFNALSKETQRQLIEMSVSAFNGKSMLVIYKDNKEKEILIDFIKYIVYQTLSMYHSDSMFVNIINPQGIPGFNDLQINRDFISKKEKEKGKLIKGPKYVTAYNTKKEVDTFLELLIEEDAKLSKGDLADKSTFKELVESKRKSGGVVPKYNINILVDMDIKDGYARFTEFAETKGIINISLVKRDIIMSTKINDETGALEESIDYKTTENCMLYDSLVEVVSTSPDIKLSVSYRETKTRQIFLYEVLSKEEHRMINSFLRERALSAKSTFKTTAEFIEDVIGTSENYWKGNAEECLSLYIGYVNGDRTKATPIILDESQCPHAFFAGTTGGGKSNMLSVMVNTMKMMYKPSDIEIVYFDFKIAEVAMHAAPYKMPQCSAMCGTSAPEYLSSLLDYVMDEMYSRYRQMSDTGTAKLSELREYYRKKKKQLEEKLEALKESGEATQEDIEGLESAIKNIIIPPRMLVLVDEAAQAFQSDDDDFKEKVKKTFVVLAQLARAAGIHMVLVSQDADKMPSALMDLLKIRGCTVAPPTISKNVLKNDFCAKDVNQFVGFFGVNSSGSGDEKCNIQYVVPYGDPKETPFFTKLANGLLKTTGQKSRDAVIFDEDKKYYKAQYDEYIHNHPEILRDGHTVLLGEGVYFQREFKPHEFKIAVDDRSSVVVCSSYTNERLRIAKLIYDCIAGRALIIPAYCKSMYKEFPLQMFKDNNLKVCPDKPHLHHYFLGKDMANYEDIIEDYGKFNFHNVCKGDLIMPQGEIPEQMRVDINGINNDLNLIDYISFMTGKRRAMIKKGTPYPTTYMMIFDYDKHTTVIDTKTSTFKALANVLNDASATDLHAIFITSDVDIYMEKAIGSKYICYRIDGIQYPNKVFKGLGSKFAKLYDLSGTYTALIKLPTE